MPCPVQVLNENDHFTHVVKTATEETDSLLQYIVHGRNYTWKKNEATFLHTKLWGHHARET